MMDTKMLCVSYPATAWTKLVLANNLEALDRIVDLAQRAVAAGGEFVLKGDPEVPTEDHRFDATAFAAWLHHENEARVMMGKAPYGSTADNDVAVSDADVIEAIEVDGGKASSIHAVESVLAERHPGVSSHHLLGAIQRAIAAKAVAVTDKGNLRRA